MDVAAIRNQIPATRRMTYMNTGWAGPTPDPVVEAIRTRLEIESRSGATSPDALQNGRDIHHRATEAVAGLLNVLPEEILLTENTTTGLNVVINGLPWHDGDEVITFDLEHPAVTVPVSHLRRIKGVRVKLLSIAPNERPDVILSKTEAALTDRTRMVVLSHIQYSCGLRMPVAEIGRLVRPRGIWLMLDGAQAAGHIRVDVREIDCDFYSLPGQKWLLGPEGTGALYIRQSLIPRIEPAMVGHGSVKTFSYPADHELKTDVIDKLRVSTTNAAMRAGFLEAIGFVRAAGTEEIERRDLALASSLKTGLASISDVRVLSPMEGPGCSGLVCFTVDGVEPRDVTRRLWDSAGILVRDIPYPPCVRASLHFFNTREEVDRLLEAVRDMSHGT